MANDASIARIACGNASRTRAASTPTALGRGLAGNGRAMLLGIGTICTVIGQVSPEICGSATWLEYGFDSRGSHRRRRVRQPPWRRSTQAISTAWWKTDAATYGRGLRPPP